MSAGASEYGERASLDWKWRQPARSTRKPMNERSAYTAMRWYALQVRPRHEKLTSSLLREKGYDEFLPLYTERRRWSDRIAAVELPLFPGYLFCRLDLHDRRAPVVTTPGVIQFVGLGRTPVPLEDAEIGAVNRAVASGLAAEPCRYTAAGDPVEITSGPLAGTQGVYVEMKKKHKLVLSVTLLQRSVAVEVDSADVMPLRRRPPEVPRVCTQTL